jgi:hypothetical protein
MTMVVGKFRQGDELPEALFQDFPEEFLRRFAAEDGFVPLGDGLPLAIAAIRRRFGSPRLEVDRTPGGNLFAMVRFDDPTGVALVGVVVDAESLELFPREELYAALPAEFAECYRWVEGMQLLASGEAPAMGWQDLPLQYSVRIPLADLLAERAVASDQIAAIHRRLESKELSAWIVCRSGDVFFADQFNAPGRLYHVRAQAPQQVSVVRGSDFLDRYFAHVVASGSSEGFDFERHLEPI